MGKITGINAEMKRLEAEITRLEKEAVADVKVAAITVVKAMHSRTPVWTGEAVRNFTVGIGSRNNSKAPGGPQPPPGSTPKGLGGEQNRASMESGSLSAANSALNKLKDLDKNVIVSNTVDAAKWDLLDNGSAPTRERARNPGGISALAIQGARAKLTNWK